MEKTIKDLSRGDQITINGVTATIESITTFDGKTYISCAPMPIEDATRMKGTQKTFSENGYKNSEQYKWLMNRFMRGEKSGQNL